MEDCTPFNYFNKRCKFNNDYKSKDIMIDEIRNFITSDNMNLLLSNLTEKNWELIIEEKHIKFHITSTENQKNKIYENISSISLGECENELKNFYNIDENDFLLIFKIEYYIPEFLVPIIEYEVYNSKTKERLDLINCKKNNKVNISIPVKIDEENIFKYNPNSPYYTDKCFSYTTDNNTDITLNDRKNEYNEKNLAICENNCSFVEYKKETKSVLCECDIKNTLSKMFDIISNKNELFNKFFDIKKISNIDFIFCKKVFSQKMDFYIISEVIYCYQFYFLIFFL